MSCEDSSSSCFQSVAAAGVVDIQCDFILQLHVFKLPTPCVSAYSDRAQSGLLCIVLKACTSWFGSDSAHDLLRSRATKCIVEVYVAQSMKVYGNHRKRACSSLLP